MSREQRRVDRKSQTRGGTTISRKTPVRAGGGGPPWLPIGIGAGVIVVVALIAYLIISTGGKGASTSKAAEAAADDSSGIPGTYAPDQGRDHLSYPFSVASQRTPIPFCAGVVWSGAPGGQAAGTPGATTPASGTAAATTPAAATPQPSGTPAASATSGSAGTPNATPTVDKTCRNSNPPSSGPHYNTQNNVDLGNGVSIQHIPADPDVYPDDVVIPRDSIPHILEHAGVYVGWNCADGDSACTGAVQKMKDVVNSRINVNHNRIVMAHDPDLVPGFIGMSSWTRWEQFKYQDYDKDSFTRFLSKNSCRVDWEGFCN
jgi:hypothetical protein